VSECFELFFLKSNFIFGYLYFPNNILHKAAPLQTLLNNLLPTPIDGILRPDGDRQDAERGSSRPHRRPRVVRTDLGRTQVDHAARASPRRRISQVDPRREATEVVQYLQRLVRMEGRERRGSDRYHHLLGIPGQFDGRADREPVDRESLPTKRLLHRAGRRDEERVQTTGTLTHVCCHPIQDQSHALLVGDGFGPRPETGTPFIPVVPLDPRERVW